MAGAISIALAGGSERLQMNYAKVSQNELCGVFSALGFETLLQKRYHRYRQGEISFGRLAQELGVTTWELSHLLDEHGWPVYNLPSAK